MKTMTMTMRSNLASEWESKEGARGCSSCKAGSDPDLCLGIFMIMIIVAIIILIIIFGLVRFVPVYHDDYNY